jgi:predicted transcriptional regulator
MPKAVRSVRLSDEVWAKLEKIAEKEKRTVSNVIEIALEGFIKKK